MSHKMIFVGLACLAWGLTACAGAATPQLIGTYPQGGSANPPSQIAGSTAPQNLYITYSAGMDLEVESPASALYTVKTIAQDYGGYLMTSRTWTDGGDDYAEATIAAPVQQFEAVRSRLHALGSVRAETISGEIRDAGPYGLNGVASFSNITVSLRPASANWAKKIGAAMGAVLTFLMVSVVVVTPPFLMIVGLVTVIQTIMRWFSGRTKPQP